MPFLTNPEVQKFVEQQTGVNPVEAVRSRLPASVTEGVGTAVMPRGTPIGFQAGQSVFDALEHRPFLKPLGNYFSTLGHDSGQSALLTALALGLGGAGFGALTGRNPVTWGVAGAGLGALGGYGASKLMESMNARRRQRAVGNMAYVDWDKGRQLRQREAMPKVSSYYGMGDEDPMTYIRARMFSDPSIGSIDKATLMGEIQNLPQRQLVTLADVLRTAVGAGVGYVITRFLLNLGPTGRMIGSVAGGLVGASMGRSLPTNAFGERVDTQHDLLGRQRFVF